MASPRTATRRELTKRQNRQAILDAARLVFAQIGFAAATVRDIIRATPLASGTFYNYFKSKEEVYQAIADDVALAIRPQLRQVRRAAKTAEEFLSSSFAVFFAFVAENRSWISPAAETTRFRMASPQIIAGFSELHEDIERAIAQGLFPDAHPGYLTRAIAGIAFELAEGVNNSEDVQEASRFATALFMGGIHAASLKAS